MSTTSAAAARLCIVVMGVSGSGKSTLAAAVAQRLQLPLVEGDDLHSASNLKKMHSGQPLDDQDRAGWLTAIATALADGSRYPSGLIITCSALRRAYRDRLRHDCGQLSFLFLEIDIAEARRRSEHRSHHFMPASLVSSQFATLEPPTTDESDVVTLDARLSLPHLTNTAIQAIRSKQSAAPLPTGKALQ